MEEKNISMEQPNALEVQVAEVTKEENGLSESQKNENIGIGSKVEGSIGKFKNTESLLSAYNNLQAEFTRKCQKLSELESLAEKTSSQNMGAEEYIKENPQMVEKILTHYLEEVKNMQSPKVITSTGGGGIPLSAPPNPTTLDEARELAKKLFK